ncbi:hypothetical protein V1507DRAFT_447712, partial [Lipomyces tetrasporus]
MSTSLASSPFVVFAAGSHTAGTLIVNAAAEFDVVFTLSRAVNFNCVLFFLGILILTVKPIIETM